MPQAAETRPARPSWNYPPSFWTANGAELFERAAYYGTFIALALYLTDVVGFTDVQAGWIGAVFSASLYLLPFLSGALADRMGFRPALVLAFTLLSFGYASLGLFPHKTAVLLSLALIAAGGSIVKPVISGTVSRSSDAAGRARAFSIFYMIVNIGAFVGKAVAYPVRLRLGLDYIPLYSAGAAVLAVLLVVFLYRPPVSAEAPRNLKETFVGMGRALRNVRFLCLILITAGFWIIQGQLYGSMPKYVIRLIGPDASPEWLSNVNSAVVILLVVPLTALAKKMSPIGSMGLAMGMVPFSALLMGASSYLPAPISFFGRVVHPLTVTMIAGIALMSVAECFLSPRYLEYASKQAPPGQEGLYLGYSHLNTFFAWFFGFVASGYLLDAFCPDPKKLSAAGMTAEQIKAAYAHAPYVWFFFAGVGAFAFLSLLAFQLITGRADRKRAAGARA